MLCAIIVKYINKIKRYTSIRQTKEQILYLKEKAIVLINIKEDFSLKTNYSYY